MTYFYQLDIAAAALALVLLIIVYTRKSFKSLRRGLFKVLLFFNLSTSLLEFFCVLISSNIIIIPPWLVQVAFIVSLTVHFTLHAIFMFYIQAVSTDTPGSKKLNILCAIIYFSIIIFVATNPLHGLVFTYSQETGVVSHLGKFLSLSLFALASIIYSIVIFVKRKNKIHYVTVLNLIFYVFLILSVIIETIFPTILIENFVIAICFSMLTIIFDNPNKFFHKNSTIFNEYTYNIVYSKKIAQKTPFSLIAFTFADLDIYIQRIGRERTDNIVIIAASFIQKRYGKDKVFIIGRNVIVVDITGLDVDKATKDIGFNCHKYAMEMNPEINLISNFCVFEYPKNIDNMSDIHDYIYAVLFGQNFDNHPVYYFNKNLLNKMLRKKRILMALYNAIENDGFEMLYQPIYNWKTNKFDSMEALIRLKDTPELGKISPAEFIPLAEDNGLIFEIDEIVFEKVCRFIRNTNLKSLGVRFVDVNMSLLKLVYPSVVDRYFELIQRYEIDPSFINLEITETAEGDEKYLQAVRQNIALFREKGFNFSLDDYGSGYSSVIYMAEMDTKIVKIDASIVWNAIKNKKYFTVLENCVRLVYCFDKECIAEGVENEQMVTMLKRLGVNYFQGYYYSKPLNETEIIDFIKEKNFKK